MTLNQATKRLEKLAIQVDSIRGRIEAITKEMAQEKPTKARAAKVAKPTGRKRAERPSPVGATIHYGGLEGKVVERKGNKFVAEMSDGKRKHVSAVYVYRQLGKKGARAKVVQQATELATQQATTPTPQDQPVTKVA